MIENSIEIFYSQKADDLTDRGDVLNGIITQKTFEICRKLHENSPSNNKYNPRWGLESTGKLAKYIDGATLTLDNNEKAIIHTAINIGIVTLINNEVVGIDLDLGTIALVDERVLASFDGTGDLDGPNAARILKRLFPRQRANRLQQ